MLLWLYFIEQVSIAKIQLQFESWKQNTVHASSAIPENHHQQRSQSAHGYVQMCRYESMHVSMSSMYEYHIKYACWFTSPYTKETYTIKARCSKTLSQTVDHASSPGALNPPPSSSCSWCLFWHVVLSAQLMTWSRWQLKLLWEYSYDHQIASNHLAQSDNNSIWMKLFPVAFGSGCTEVCCVWDPVVQTMERKVAGSELLVLWPIQWRDPQRLLGCWCLSMACNHQQAANQPLLFAALKD